MASARSGRGVRPFTLLEEYRRRRALTQAEVARQAGINRQYVTAIEGGLVPPPRVRAALAGVLEASPEELWGVEA